jgi:hypothetical protein
MREIKENDENNFLPSRGKLPFLLSKSNFDVAFRIYSPSSADWKIIEIHGDFFSSFELYDLGFHHRKL